MAENNLNGIHIGQRIQEQLKADQRSVSWLADSLIEAFSKKIKGDTSADLSMKDFEATIKCMVPMGQMRKDEFTKLRQGQIKML